MTLDNFFAGSEDVWKKELARREKEAADKRAAELGARREAIKDGKKSPKTEPAPPLPPLPPASSADFSIEALADCYRINGVKLRGDSYTMDLNNALLSNGESKKQDDWVEFKKQAGKDDFVPADAPTYHAACTALYDNRENKKYGAVIELARQFLATQFQKYWLTTLSRVRYHPRQAPQSILKRAKNVLTGQQQTTPTLDEVIHDYGAVKPVAVSAAIAGPQNYISQLSDASTYCKAVIDDKDVAHVNEVYKWIAGKDTYAWRLTESPDKDIEERVVALGVYDYVRFGLNAGDYIGDGPALGVRFVAQKMLNNATGVLGTLSKPRLLSVSTRNEGA